MSIIRKIFIDLSLVIIAYVWCAHLILIPIYKNARHLRDYPLFMKLSHSELAYV